MLDVCLGDTPVGTIVREEQTGVLAFVLDADYFARPRRPVLGQQFEDRRQTPVFRQAAYPGELPAFFANLLPEGALEAMIKAQVRPEDATQILAYVGADLPGAVRVFPSKGAPLEIEKGGSFDESFPLPAESGQLRFSLAGVQLKFSAVEAQEDRFTLPFSGLGGKWILKFATGQYPGLPENEFTIMRWARESGLDVPEHRLVSAAGIEGIDPRIAALGANVFAIRRYDRLPNGGLVHQEDFCQVHGLPPHMKYDRGSVDGLARLVADLCGEEDLLEFVRRVVFAVLAGNVDIHLKNWSLVYPDGRTARLSPAYDFVCVRQYLPDQPLALPLAKEKSATRISWDHFRNVERYLGRHGHPLPLVERAMDFARCAMDVWERLRTESDLATVRAVESHLAALELVRMLRPST